MIHKGILQRYQLWRERRLVTASNLFDADRYLAKYPDVLAAGQDALVHYMRTGAAEGRVPHPLFDPAWYLDQYPDVRTTGQNPLIHYLLHGAAEGRSPHPLFDVTWYLTQNPDVRAAGANPLVHYLKFGASKGRDPHPLFDTSWYLAKNADVRLSGQNPLLHYLLIGASRGCNPNALFDTTFYLGQIRGSRRAGIIPLAHYLQTGAAIGLRPSPLFDPLYYIRTYPDVAATNLDALTHYRHFGAAERRNPSAEFDANVYWDQLSPEEQARCPDALAHHYEVGSTMGIAFSESQVREQIVGSCANGRPTILVILHGSGGGIEKHVRDIVDIYGDRINVLLMIAKPDNRAVIFVGTGQGAKLYLDPKVRTDQIISLLRECNVARLHVHHWLGHEYYLRSIIKTLALPFDLTIHDYYLLSPHPHLSGLDGCFVGEDLSATAVELLNSGLAPVRPHSLEEWQREHRWLFTDADRVIVPSNDAARRITAHMPARSLIVAAHPHDETTISVAVSAPRCELDTPLRIAVLGYVALHKGLAVILSCARRAKAGRDPLQFHIIGPAEQEPELLSAGVSVTGRYRHCDLPRLIQEYGPHLLWYPAQTPETFSYTLSEGLKTNLPLVIGNLGALPERVGGRPWVWIRPWNLEPKQWNDFFVSIRARNFTTGIPPEIVGTAWEVTDEFYKSGYLDWIETTEQIND